jgi:hypothetical protein
MRKENDRANGVVRGRGHRRELPLYEESPWKLSLKDVPRECP